jgi:N-acetylglucosaminyltransferase
VMDLWEPMAVAAVPVLSTSYASLLLSHFSWQQRLARKEKRGRYRQARWTYDVHLPSVDVIVPCFDEDPDLLRVCCDALAEQTYRGRIQVFLVDDGSATVGGLEPIYGSYGARPGWMVLRLAANAGKRRAQDAAIQCGYGDLVVNVDSDTVVDRTAIEKLANRFAELDIGMIAGKVTVLNADKNRLTKLVATRYDLLFDQERAAQSLHGAVLCCAGAFAAYRRTELDKVWPRYLAQRFAGALCTSGEDLHLTLLLLAGTMRSVYEPRAVAQTLAPPTLRRYLRQQLRWARCFYRELRWTLPVLRRRPAFMTIDVLARTLLPVLLPLAATLAAVNVALTGGDYLLRDGLLIIAVCVLHISTVVCQTKGLGFLPYGLLYAALLIPMRLYALATMNREVWEGRGGIGGVEVHDKRAISVEGPLADTAIA